VRIRRQADARKRVAAKLAHEKAIAPYQARADRKAAEREAAKEKKRRADQRQSLVDVNRAQAALNAHILSN
jgi:hypothetical protein